MTALLLSAVLAQAAAPRDVRVPAHGTGAIHGSVTSDELDSKPVRKVRITCAGQDGASGASSVTDDAGQFTCGNLPPGRYSVTAVKPGWVTASYGARRPNRPGTSVPVADGQKADIAFRLTHGAVITGTLLDQDGQPLTGAPVRALRYVMSNGERRLLPAGVSEATDDRGVYRIYGLPPGDYVVVSAGDTRGLNLRGGELRLTTELDLRHAMEETPSAPPPQRTVSVAPTFYPGTATASQAGMVSLRAGEEHGGVDFMLQLVKTARVEGTISAPDGTPAPPGAQLTLVGTGEVQVPGIPFAGFRLGHTAGDGTFSFADVAPGSYMIVARAALPQPASDGRPAAPPQIVWAVSDLAVDGESISGVSLMLQPGMTLSGRVRFESATGAQPDPKSVRISLAPVQSPGMVNVASSGATLNADGTFTLAGITPGRYRLTASLPGLGRAGGWALRSAMVAGQDTLDVPFTIQGTQNITDATITLTDRLAQLTGRVQNASGGAVTDYTIVVFPSQPHLWLPQARRIHAIRPGADGVYTFRNLPAGSYLLAAVDDVEPGEWFDPAFLQRLVATAMNIEIADGEQKTQDVKIGIGSE